MYENENKIRVILLSTKRDFIGQVFPANLIRYLATISSCLFKIIFRHITI